MKMCSLVLIIVISGSVLHLSSCERNFNDHEKGSNGNSMGRSVIGISGISQLRYFNYPAGDNTNRLFINVASGNFDGSGISTIAMLKKQHSQIIFMRTANDANHYQISFSFSVDIADNDFRGIAGGDVDGDGYDELILLRNSSVSNILVYDIPLNFSGTATLKSSLKIGSGLYDWKGLAVADFNGDGKADMAVLKNTVSQIIVYSMSGNSISLSSYVNLATDPMANRWGGISGGDLDNDGKAEIIAVREGDNNNPDFLFYKFSGWSPILSGAFNLNGGTAHYPWLGVVIGEFDHDKSNGKEFVTYKNSNGFFTYQYYKGNTTAPTTMGQANFSSDANYPWRDLAVGQVMLNTGGEHLIAVRQKPNDATVAIFGNETASPLEKKNKLSRNNFSFGCYWQGLTQFRNTDGTLNINALKTFCDNNKILHFSFLLAERWKSTSGSFPPDGSEYVGIIRFLELLKTTNSPIKVSVVLAPPSETNADATLLPDPGDSPLIGAQELGNGINDERLLFQGTPKANDFIAWFKLLGIVGKKYPNFAGIIIDDFQWDISSNDTDGFFNRIKLGKMIKELRTNSETISFLPVVYFAGDHYWIREYADGFVYYFRNQSGYKKLDNDNQIITPARITPPDELRSAPYPSYWNMHGAIGLPSSVVAGGQNYVNTELNSFAYWMANNTKLLFLGIYASPHSLSITKPTAFTTVGLMDQAKLNANTDGVVIYLTQDPISPIGQAIYSKFNSWW